MTSTPLRLVTFLLPVLLSATGVTSQEVTVSHVKTTSLQLHWQKEGNWSDVVTYDVKIKANDHLFCTKTQNCFLAACTFRTEDNCGMLPPCAKVVATVTGGGHTAPTINVQTAPEAITDLQVTGLFVQKEITWTNPNSSCFVDTVVSISYGGYYDYTETLTPAESSTSVALCNTGSGFVSVRARGGDGEADPQIAVLLRVNGDDTVAITSCPNDGCTDMTVQWAYEPVCPEVTHFEVKISLEANTIDSATTDLINTTATFEDLELDTVYWTCVSALDKDEKLMASSCTSCGTYPEKVEELVVVNITDTTAEIEWAPPLCQVDDNFEYNVSYSRTGLYLSANTTNTNFLWTELSPFTNHTFCVLVQHPGAVQDHAAVCTSSFTLPAALESVEVRVYETTSLFVTWPAPLFTPEMEYLVSWGEKVLDNSDSTEYHSYTIEEYNQTAGPNIVCVQSVTRLPPGLTGKKTCQEQPFAVFGDEKPDNTAMIVSVSVSAGLAVLLSVVLVVVANMQQKTTRDTT